MLLFAGLLLLDRCGALEVVKLLLAQPQVKHICHFVGGTTPIEEARAGGHAAVVSVLAAHLAQQQQEEAQISEPPELLRRRQQVGSRRGGSSVVRQQQQHSRTSKPKQHMDGQGLEKLNQSKPRQKQAAVAASLWATNARQQLQGSTTTAAAAVARPVSNAAVTGLQPAPVALVC